MKLSVGGRITSYMNILQLRDFKHVNRLLAGLFVAVCLLSAGCYDTKSGRVDIGGEISFELAAFPETGPHAVEMWTEMHFQPSYRVQEGPRLLPALDSVPVTGAEIVPGSMDEYKQLSMPDEISNSYDHDEAEKSYNLNCLVCHGATMDGEGPIVKLASNRSDGTPAYNKGPFPANLSSDATLNSTDGELFGFISGGGRQGLAMRLRGRDSTSPMPEFSKLLNERERWLLVQYLRDGK